MQFASFRFVIFYVVVFLAYWLIGGKRPKWQNLFLLAASYAFYCFWDWRLLSIMAVMSVATWLSGVAVSSKVGKPGMGKAAVTVNVILCIAALALFKYYGFFRTEFGRLLGSGVKADGVFMKLVLPVGISFYSFKAVSYSIDVLKGRIKAESNPVPVFLYLSFFPQILAGPITLARSFVPQAVSERSFRYEDGVNAMRHILWGAFKKIVIADQCAVFVDEIFGSYATQCGSSLLIAAIMYSIQIYADFSGYSDMSIGLAQLLGYRIAPNFRAPYFSRNVAEFWRRWHISLTSWFKEYVYFPMGGSRCSMPRVILNTAVIFILSGLWHGANWTYIVWGAYYALLFVPLLLTGRSRKYKGADEQCAASCADLLNVIVTFSLVTLGWIVFRSNSISDAVGYISGMWQWGTLKSVYRIFTWSSVRLTTILTAVMLLAEWFGRSSETPFHLFDGKPRIIRLAAYVVTGLAIFWFRANANAFVYQQF